MTAAAETPIQAGTPEDGVRVRRAISFEEYLRWEPEGGLAEWVRGEGVQYVSTTKYHQNVVQFLVALLLVFLRSHRLGRVMSAPYAMRAVPGGNAREPDVFFIRNERVGLMRDTFLDGPADLVVEVVSDDSVTRDRVEKFDEYQEAGVREYWVIDPRPGQQRALFYVLRDGLFVPVKPDADGAYRSTVLDGLRLEIAWLWQEEPDLVGIFQQMT